MLGHFTVRSFYQIYIKYIYIYFINMMTNINIIYSNIYAFYYRIITKIMVMNNKMT